MAKVINWILFLIPIFSVKSIRDGYSFNFSGSIIKFTIGSNKPNPNDSRIIPISIKIKRIIPPNLNLFGIKNFNL